MDYEADSCFKCGRVLRDFDEYPPVLIPGKGEICADCYSALTNSERSSYFRGI